MHHILRNALPLAAWLLPYAVWGQHDTDRLTDSLYIQTVQDRTEPDKVLHAEPLYIDLIRDLGARKGEQEWNVGFGISDKNQYDEYVALVEYEWAPIDRLGLEVELPFSFYYKGEPGATAPSSALNSVKMAAQWSFFVSQKWKTSMALGYIHEFEMAPFREYERETLFTGMVFNPFFVAAKRWGQNWHTLVYTGPRFVQHFDGHTEEDFQINSNLHYMIPGTRNFIGIECNKVLDGRDSDMTLRPQMRVGVSEQLLVGIVTGIPIGRENERFSTFIRLIYEPGHP